MEKTMKDEISVSGSRVEEVKITASGSEILTKLICKMYREIIPSNIPADAYINEEGKWETWDSFRGHGSGITETYGNATESQKAAMKTISDFKDLYRRLKKD